MKINITLRDPHGIYDGVVEAVNRSFPEGLPEESRGVLKRMRHSLAEEAINKWFKSDSSITIEIDTDANTCVVVVTFLASLIFFSINLSNPVFLISRYAGWCGPGDQ